MPSLRRTLSAPSRSSPYSSSTQTRTSPRSPRRSSGSDTANRRVLADIDWWRVEEGQREVRGLSPDEQLRPATPASDDEEVDQEERAPSPVAATLFTTPSHNSGSSTDLPLWHNVPGAGWDTFDGFELPSSDIDSADPFEIPSTLSQFAALSLNPVGRATLHRSVSSSSAFSDMSFESDSSYSSPTSVSASLTLGFEDFVASPADDSDDEYDVPEAILSRAPRLPSVATPTTTRSVSYSAVESELSSSRDLFSYFGGDDDDTDDWSSDGNSSNEDVFF